MKTKCLNDIPIGASAVVDRLLIHGSMRRRLLDIGLMRGEKVRCVGCSPLRDPRAYLICGAVIALRRADAQNVTVCDISCGEKERV